MSSISLPTPYLAAVTVSESWLCLCPGSQSVYLVLKYLVHRIDLLSTIKASSWPNLA